MRVDVCGDPPCRTLGAMGLLDRFRRGRRRGQRRHRGHRAGGGQRATSATCWSSSARARGRGLRRAAHDGHRRDAAARRARRGVDPATGPVGGVGARLRQPQRRPVVRRRAGRHPARMREYNRRQKQLAPPAGARGGPGAGLSSRRSVLGGSRLCQRAAYPPGWRSRTRSLRTARDPTAPVVTPARRCRGGPTAGRRRTR